VFGVASTLAADPWIGDMNFKLLRSFTCGYEIKSTSEVEDRFPLKVRGTDNKESRPTRENQPNDTMLRTTVELKASGKENTQKSNGRKLSLAVFVKYIFVRNTKVHT
jgi:hypothetical protein